MENGPVSLHGQKTHGHSITADKGICSHFRTPEGLEDVSRYPYLFAELLKDDSWSEEDLKKLAGLNFLRVFRTVEQVCT